MHQWANPMFGIALRLVEAKKLTFLAKGEISSLKLNTIKKNRTLMNAKCENANKKYKFSTISFECGDRKSSAVSWQSISAIVSDCDMVDTFAWFLMLIFEVSLSLSSKSSSEIRTFFPVKHNYCNNKMQKKKKSK